MTLKTHYIVQMYERRKQGRGKSVLAKAQAVECRDAGSAALKATKTYEGGYYVGVDAYKIEIDSEVEEYGEPEFLIRLGDVPKVEG